MGGLLYPLPGFAAIVMFVILWRNDDLRRPWIAGSACLIGISLQFFSDTYSPTWVAGLVLNVLTAIGLMFRWKLSSL